MTLANRHRGIIPPVEPGVDRPLWSVMIPTYNCASYLRETLESVLAQDPGPERMQIEVVDDGSVDDPGAVVEEVGRGRVGFHRRPTNGGHVANFNSCIQRARGHLVHVLHGDDMVREGFYAEMERAFTTRPEIGAAFCRTITMDERGVWGTLMPVHHVETGLLPDAAEALAVRQRITPAAVVVRRSVYEELGGFDDRFSCSGEDWEMWVRIAASFPIWYGVKPLALYRKHGNSLTGRWKMSGDNVRDTRLAIDIFGAHLPADRAAHVTRRAKEETGLWAIRTAEHLLRRGEARAALNQIREGLRCGVSPRIGMQLVVLAAWLALRWLPRTLGVQAARAWMSIGEVAGLRAPTVR
jgi:GT2 family glycosyltransferase